MRVPIVFISRKNCTSQSKFSCKECRHTENVDINAVRNIFEYEKWSQYQQKLIQDSIEAS